MFKNLVYCDNNVHQFRETYKKIDLDKSYRALFELLWYSQLPCFDVLDVTSQLHEEFGHSIIWENCPKMRNNISYSLLSGMIKKCLWKGQRLNCSSIFKMHPTDRGMCCAFNKQKADEMFKVNRYQEQIMYLTEQDRNKSYENAEVPSWWVLILQSGWSGCRTGKGKRLSSSQAQLGQATYLAVA